MIYYHTNNCIYCLNKWFFKYGEKVFEPVFSEFATNGERKNPAPSISFPEASTIRLESIVKKLKVLLPHIFADPSNVSQCFDFTDSSSNAARQKVVRKICEEHELMSEFSKFQNDKFWIF